MASTLDDLISPEEPDDVLTYFLTELANVGFSTTAWQTGGVVYTLLKIESQTISDKVKLVTAIAKGVLLDLSTGKWLTLLAKSAYNIDRYLTTFAVGNVRVAVGATYPPQTITPGQLWIRDNAGRRFSSANTSSVVIGAGSSAVISFRAELTGSAQNLANGTGMSLVTPLPGVTAALEVGGTGTWLTVQGADEEKDDNLRARCRTRWATIGLQKTRDAYYWLATNVPGLTTQPNRVVIDDQNPRGPGTVDVWFAGPAGPLPTADETAIRAYVDDRASPCTDVDSANAPTLTVDVVATVHYRAQYGTALAEAQTALTALIQNTPVGGELVFYEVTEALTSPNGVFDLSAVTINGVAANLSGAPNKCMVAGTLTLTPLAVP